MEALIIEGNDKAKLKLLATLAKELGLNVKQKNITPKIPNEETLAAMEEINDGKGKKFESVQALFDSIK